MKEIKKHIIFKDAIKKVLNEGKIMVDPINPNEDLFGLKDAKES